MVSLLTEELNDKGYHAGARALESVRYTSFGVPRVARRLIADIADDAGNPLYQGVTTTPDHPNSGVNEADYTLFNNSFFTQQAVGDPTDIADDQGQPLVYGVPIGAGVPGAAGNSGVNESDFNCFFNHFFNETSTRPSTEAGGGGDRLLEWGELSFPETNNRIGYAGYWWDEHLNMYCVRNRWYMPRTGRWLTPDPIGYAGGRNLFEYCQNRPSQFCDPSGLWFEDLATWLVTRNNAPAQWLGYAVGIAGGYTEGGVTGLKDEIVGVAKGANEMVGILDDGLGMSRELISLQFGGKLQVRNTESMGENF
ncbi:hypothetical protein BH11PLA1_BH11PLA1_01570 [soil metagenome]